MVTSLQASFRAAATIPPAQSASLLQVRLLFYITFLIVPKIQQGLFYSQMIACGTVNSTSAHFVNLIRDDAELPAGVWPR